MDGSVATRRAPFGDSPVLGSRGSRTKDAIVRAALEVFGTHGYHATRVELITEAAGCSRPAFYQYFANKEDLFRTLAGTVAKDLTGMLDGLTDVTRDRDGRDTLRDWLGGLVSYHRDHLPIFANFSTAVRADHVISSTSPAITDRFAEALLRAFDPTPEWPDGHRRAAVVTTMILRAQGLWPRAEPGLGHDRFVEAMADLVHRIVHGPIEGVNVTAPSRRPRRRDYAPPGPGPVVAEGAASDALLAAGREVFPRLGIHATRVDDIVTAAGVSHGTFYRYFPNKDSLFDVLLRDATRVLVELARGFPADGGVHLVREWGERWFDVHERHGLIFSVWTEADPSEPVVAASFGRVARPVAAALGEALARRDFGDPHTDAIALLSVVERLPSTVSVLAQMTRHEAVEELVALVADGFLRR